LPLITGCVPPNKRKNFFSHLGASLAHRLPLAIDANNAFGNEHLDEIVLDTGIVGGNDPQAERSFVFYQRWSADIVMMRWRGTGSFWNMI